MIDLRSDTQTKPSQGMREAMATAEVGDEQEREDPTVLELERRGAELLGQEEAVYLPTATMGNQIALAILGERGHGALRRGARPHHGGRAGRRRVPLGAADARAPGAPRSADARSAARGELERGWLLGAAGVHPGTREHPQHGRRHGLAAGRAPGGRRHRTRARDAGASRRRTPCKRGGCIRCRRGGDRRQLRHRDALPLEGARLSARCVDRRLAGPDGSCPHGEAPIRRCDASGRHRCRGRALCARSQRRPSRRGSRSRAQAR